VGNRFPALKTNNVDSIEVASVIVLNDSFGFFCGVSTIDRNEVVGHHRYQ
jgi:hypothetical protein